MDENKKKPGKFKRGAKKVGKRFFNPKAWMDTDRLMNTAKAIKQHSQGMYKISAPKENVETFEEAAARFNLSPKELKSKMNNFKWLACFFAILSIAMGWYTLYSLWNSFFLAGLVSFGLMAGLLGFIFKYHFWYFQMSRRRLGCTIQEWWNFGVLGKKEKSSEHRMLD